MMTPEEKKALLHSIFTDLDVVQNYAKLAQRDIRALADDDEVTKEKLEAIADRLTPMAAEVQRIAADLRKV